MIEREDPPSASPVKTTERKLRNEAGTPKILFQRLHSQYSFTLDVCANPHNAKLAHYWDEKVDSLKQRWNGHRVFCNPPFSDIPPWLTHAREPNFACYLLPVRSDRWWWAEWKPFAECHYLIGEKPERRPQFEPPPGIKYSGNPLCLCLFLFGDGCEPGKELYRSGLDGRLIAP